MGISQADRVNGAVAALKRELCNLGLVPDSVVYAIKDACDECSKFGEKDCDGSTCEIKEKRYLAKLTLSEIKIVVKEEESLVYFVDSDGNDYSVDRLNDTLFTDRQEALTKL